MARIDREELAAMAEALRERGLTLEGLSQATGYSPEVIGWLFEGKLRPTLEVRQRLARALGFDPKGIE